MFLDLNVPYPSHGGDLAELKKTVSLLRELGYQGVAYNFMASGKEAANKTNPIKILDLSELGGHGGVKNSASDLPSVLSASRTTAKEFQQLSRLTVILEDISANYQLTVNNPNVASYDLIAVQPTNEKLFLAACSSLEIDIISLDMGSRLPFYIKQPMVNLALQRGLFFEISYGGAIRDASARRHLIRNAASLIRATKGKNVIITSEAQKDLELRGPYDVINLASIFSLNQALAKNSISANCRAVLYRSATRRQTNRGVLSVEPSANLAESNKWKEGILDDTDEGEDAMDET
ncbi:uncharacterized protein SPPG_05388 [Spizellomyces punctatus DAOM BR117]|uniref:RNase P subunit p30 n=1 Tax=Spizellomyces punctatus (strain DAOM BR117) TaxID=645134 RepID=A0A0L0HDT6_SPIPD|nr:uncharacterized protein SPPG_05388 [Spizellomyces punctatus DAOM BR117]KNC99129.1 hypothetical protein SPPG_05388 [Spizellomyces punctatus DAOM BR117]|eukprot:XP_016607169.1 hypothetical protein SPPG_05388 [Spizellomyces punctatus DAOM BR117]